MSFASQLGKLSRKHSGVRPWLCALAVFSASLAARLALSPWLDAKFLTFFPAIAASALICGWAEGVLVLVLSTLAAWYFLAAPTQSFQISSQNDIVELVGFLLAGGFIILVVAAMRELVASLEEARQVHEDLFRELQHRVANSYQIVLGMLRNAHREISDERTAQVLKEAEERIWAMAQLHRRLHDGDAYLNGLEPLLQEVLADVFGHAPVSIRLEIQPGSNLSLNQMTALTLLVNEAAINAEKHVFSKHLGQSFEVSLVKQGDGRLRLLIRDDGPGMSAAAAAKPRTRSLGMAIMQAFANQLGGPLRITGGDSGTTLTLEFAPG